MIFTKYLSIKLSNIYKLTDNLQFSILNYINYITGYLLFIRPTKSFLCPPSPSSSGGRQGDYRIPESPQLHVKPLPTELVELYLPGEVSSHYVLHGFGDWWLECVAVDLVEIVQLIWNYKFHSDLW